MEEMNESKRVRKVIFSEPISFHGYEGIKDYYNDGTYVKYIPAESGIEEYEEGTHNYTEMELALMAILYHHMILKMMKWQDKSIMCYQMERYNKKEIFNKQ